MFTKQARKHISQIAELMMEMNSHENQNHAIQGSHKVYDQHKGTYGYLREALLTYIEIELCVDVYDTDFNWGGIDCGIEDVVDCVQRHLDLKDDYGDNQIIEWKEGPYRLEVYDIDESNRILNDGTWKLDYRFFFHGLLTHWGKMAVNSHQATDSLQTLQEALQCVARQQDTQYQVEFSQEFGDELHILANQVEDSDSWRC